MHLSSFKTHTTLPFALLTVKLMKFLGYFLKEVVFQDAGGAPDDFDIQVFLLKDLIYIGACTTELLGKPCDGSPLLMQYGLNELTGVYHLYWFVISL